MNANAPIQTTVSDMDRYLFDLNGYLIIKNALSADEVAQMNDTYDQIEEHAKENQGRSWFGNVMVNTAAGQHGISMQQLYEGGPVWEKLINHPSWLDKVKHFIGTDDPENFDGHHGPAFIDECFGTIRTAGDAQRLHSGGHVGTIRTQYRYHAGKFHCGQVNILMAMTDIGPGDGATMVVPGSHKSNIAHPQTVPVEKRANDASSMDGIEGAIEAHLEKGDALLFVDAIAHGSARRTNPEGQRRVAVYRYGPSWGYFRLPVRPSEGLMSRLSEEQRKFVNPHPDPISPENS